ncbi:MAG: hypothetical protein R3D60_06360 [Paracoccaceae bacterium]
MAHLIRSRIEAPALTRLVQRGHVLLAGPTPSDAAHVLGRQTGWDSDAAHKALTLMARKRGDSGDRLAPDGATMAARIVDQLTRQTVDCLLEAAFDEDTTPWEAAAETLARHELTRAAFAKRPGLVQMQASLAVPVIGLGASAGCYYGAVGEALNCPMIVPEHAGVANAVGAVVSQVSVHLDGLVTSPAPGLYIAHCTDGPTRHPEAEAAVDALVRDLTQRVTQRAHSAGVDSPHIRWTRTEKGAEVEGQSMLIEVALRVSATGRPRIAAG